MLELTNNVAALERALRLGADTAGPSRSSASSCTDPTQSDCVLAFSAPVECVETPDRCLLTYGDRLIILVFNHRRIDALDRIYSNNQFYKYHSERAL